MDRMAIARALREAAALLEASGDGPYRARAYLRGARAIETTPLDLDALARSGRLTEIPGIGKGLAAVVQEMAKGGTSASLERLRREVPPGVVELGRIPHLTTARIRALDETLGVRTLADLRQAVAAGRLREVRGFGAALEERVRQALLDLDQRAELRLLDVALAEGERIAAHLLRAGAARVDLAGAARRGTDAVDRVELVASGPAPAALLDTFEVLPDVVERLERGPARAEVRLADGFRAVLHAVPPDQHATMLFQATGSEQHVARVVELLAQAPAPAPAPEPDASGGPRRGVRGTSAEGRAGRGRSGPVRPDAAPAAALPSEASIYALAGLPDIPPELREDQGELEAALAGDTFADLVTDADVRGLVHCHTVHSDGTATVEAMARAADALGMEYITITDHSPTASYAGGLTVERLERVADEIARVQEQVKVRILHGTESDILADGALDYPDAVLRRLDVIVASIHNRYKMDAGAMTRRLVTAMRLPLFKIWGHGLGRYVLSRPPIDCDVEEVLDAVAGSRAAVEVNGDPHRLDLEPRWIRQARRRGIRFVLSTDAHSIRALVNFRFAVTTARRGGVRRQEVLNTRSFAEFSAAVRPE